MVDRTHRELTDDDVARIAATYHAWRGEKPALSNVEGDAGEYAYVPGFCKSAPLDEVRKHGHVLTPGRYVGAEAQEDDGEPFEEKMKRLTATLPPGESDLAAQVFVREFLLEPGAGFALIGNQVKLTVGDADYFLDLLFYHGASTATWSWN